MGRLFLFLLPLFPSRRSRRTLFPDHHLVHSAPPTAQMDTNSNDMFSQIFREHASIMLLIDADQHRLIAANKAATRFYGYSEAQMRGMPLELINRQGRAHIARTMENIREQGLFTFEFTHTLADGSQREVEVHTSPITLGDQKNVLFSIIHDITEHKLAEQALERGEEILSALIEHALDMIVVVDHEKKFVFVSPSVERVLGYKPAELVGNHANTLTHPEDDAALISQFQELIDTPGQFAEMTYRIKHADGSWRMISSVVRNLLEDSAIRGLVFNSRDITRKTLVAQELRDYANRLEANNRELKEFAYVASHDLQEPLRKIRAFGDRLDRQYSDALGERGQDYLRRMNQSAERMSTLIHDLLEFSRLSTRALPTRDIDLNKVLEGVLSDLELTIRENRATFDIEELPTLQADPTQMRQLLQNLVSNALKFRDSARRPHIEISTHQLGHKPCTPHAFELIVRDNGIGFDQKHAQNVFLPFHRLHKKHEYSGTGIGLAICRRIAERHAGNIQAFSTPGDGATFVITLPREQVQHSPLTHPLAPQDPSP